MVAFGTAAAGVLALSTTVGVVKMHERLSGFDELRNASIIADQLLGPDCKLATSRTPQVSWYSDCYAGRSRANSTSFDGGPESDADVLRAEASALGAVEGEIIGYLLLDGLSTEPAIDQLWEQRVETQSAVLSSELGRRVGLMAVQIP